MFRQTANLLLGSNKSQAKIEPVFKVFGRKMDRIEFQLQIKGDINTF